MGNPRGGRASGSGRGGGRGMGRGRGGENNPLHDAARTGDLIKVQSILCSNPLAINSRDRHSRTPYVSSHHIFTILLPHLFVFFLIVECPNNS